MANPSAISTLGDLRRAVDAGRVPHRSVHQEVRENLIDKLRRNEPLFPGAWLFASKIGEEFRVVA